MINKTREEFEKLLREAASPLPNPNNGVYYVEDIEKHKSFAYELAKSAKADSEKEIAERQTQIEILKIDLANNKQWYERSEKENTELQAQVKRLRDGYSEAIEDIECWAEYAGEYFKNKHRLSENLETHRKLLAETPAQSLKEHDDALIDKCVKAIIDVGGQRA